MSEASEQNFHSIEHGVEAKKLRTRDHIAGFAMCLAVVFISSGYVPGCTETAETNPESVPSDTQRTSFLDNSQSPESTVIVITK